LQEAHVRRFQPAAISTGLLAMTLIAAIPTAAPQEKSSAARVYLVGQIGSYAVVQVYADGFDQLTPSERVLAYHLAEAGIAGDPIYYDQIAPYGLELKRLLEGIWTHPAGIPAATLKKIQDYTQLFWIGHGNYNPDSTEKFLPDFTQIELRDAARKALHNGADFGVKDNKGLDFLLERLDQPIFDKTYRPQLTAKSPPPGQDILSASANNLYEHVTPDDLAGFTEHYPLNSRMEKRGGHIFENVWRAGTPDRRVPPGLYASQIGRIVEQLSAAATVAPPLESAALLKLIKYYETGEKSDWYDYNIAWVQTPANVDAINGFIEVYLDPRGEKGAYESVVSFVDQNETQLMRQFAANAQYFEQRAPWLDEYKKQNVQPPVANVVTIVSEAGDGGPLSAAGINLPNEQDIRQQYGTKSTLLLNVTTAWAEAIGQRSLEEFSSSDEEKVRGRKYGLEARKLVIAMHEVLGHGSGKVSDKLTADPRVYLKEYYSTLEEARADLVALWDFTDPKLTELGIQDQQELMKAAYDAEARAALTILYHYPQGDQVVEDHDRGTQMIVGYLMKNCGCIEAITQNSKIYLRVTDYDKMHQGIGTLLAELMRIKAEGDYPAIQSLVDTYGVKIDPTWRDQVVARAKAIQLPTRGVFLSPLIEPVYDASHHVVDARIHYPNSLAEVMLDYSRKSLGYLPAAPDSTP
jgi:dipeptidyl-peptidase-3